MSQNQQPLNSLFMGWQCRIRQHVVRKHEGRPCSGMRPEAMIDGASVASVMTMIVRSDSKEVTQEFRFMVQKTQDPKIRYDNGIRFLSEYYYQKPALFDEELTAIFSVGSAVGEQLCTAERCMLSFAQANQRFELMCQTRAVGEDEDKYQATYWHNMLFNPSLPGKVLVVGFTPIWDESQGITT